MKKKKNSNNRKKIVAIGRVTILASFNNIIISFADLQGDVLVWSSAGERGFKGSRKSMPYAAQVTAKHAAERAFALGMRTVSIFIQGPGSGRESAMRAIGDAGFNITSIKDVTPVPHNGCRPPKRRRV